ncbi:hypothetical protein GALMADRAFT_143484 [Galerina marginata CBS 339.88]|uniref:Uncharacterized protein n=1 Tax=Galerina marginata (strain CBS 339.88) TaxID=685588 RepID=A0A067SL45_GALM3|nr:hypothetical protein GALMADRAFT_143484 [Galerina marginata CBS 339.88]
MSVPRTLCDADKHHGRAQIVNGDIFYSPNCTRELANIPEQDSHNILLPYARPEEIRAPRNFSRVNLADYQSPRWWSIPFGWVAFVPTRPDFFGPILGTMNRLPQCNELRFEEGLGYSMPEGILRVWRDLELDIIHAVGLLAVHTESSPLLPAYPTIFGYRHHHKSWRAALIAFERSRDWLVMWISVLAYLIAVAETKTSARENSPLLALTDWYSHLVKNGCSESWLEALTMSSMICEFTLWAERAGTFVSLTDLRADVRLPSVEWLCAFGIPNWYRWKLEWSKDPKYAAYTPLAHHLQDMFDGIPPRISSNWDVMQHQGSSHSLTAPMNQPIPPQNACPLGESREGNLTKGDSGWLVSWLWMWLLVSVI